MQRKKVLIISYYWPPCGGIGVLRALKIAKYLRENNWEPVVYTAENAHYPSIDEGNYKDVPDGITVLKQPIWEPYDLFNFIAGRKKKTPVGNIFFTQKNKSSLFTKLSIWIRSNFFIPDARAFWVKPSVNYLTAYLKNNPVDAIFSDGPPHSNTLIACLVKEKTGIPWLADFQDPWTQVDYFAKLNLTAWAYKKHHKLEQKALSLADKVTIVSPTWKKDLEAIGAKNVSVIYWGYDEDDFRGKSFGLFPKFTICHAGLLGNDRKPETLFKVLADLKKEDVQFANSMLLKLAGEVDSSVKDEITLHSLSANTELLGQLSRASSIELMLRSHILLLPLNKAKNAKGRIPGKFFEYLRAKRPILAFGPIDSDVASILNQTKAGKTIEYDNYDEMKLFIQKEYEKFKATPKNEFDIQIEGYSIQKQTKLIATYLDELTNSNEKV